MYCPEYNSVLLEGLDELPGLSAELLNLDSLCNWQGEIEDIDTDALVRYTESKTPCKGTESKEQVHRRFCQLHRVKDSFVRYNGQYYNRIRLLDLIKATIRLIIN